MTARANRSRRRGCVLVLSGIVGVGLWASTGSAGAAAVKASIKKDVLTVIGTPGADSITLRLRAGDPNTLEVDVGADGTADLTFDRRRFKSIIVEGGPGNDTLVASHIAGSFTSTQPTTLDGGDGNDTLLGEAGGETLIGGNGDDFADGNMGADAISLGDGNDVVQWDPGDTSDTVTGGTGADRLAFNGSNAPENFDLFAAAGGHVRLTRDVAAVTLDLDDVEIVELRSFGSADNVTVNNLAGTDLTEVRTDFAASVGGDDGAIDSVVVAPGVTIGRDATAAVVDGLGAKVRVLNGSSSDRIQVTGAGPADVVTIAGTPGADTISVVANGTDVAVQGATPGVLVNLTTVETLRVNLAGGGDSFSAVGNIAPLVTLDVDGGEGNDTVLGGNGADMLRGGIGDDHLDGQQGTDTISLGDGNDVVQWDPGDGNDTITGGTGSDRLAFNGSAANENFDVSVADGGHVRFARDIAAIALDLDDVEVVDVRSFAGVDTLTVGNLAGSDLTEVRTDLAAVGGGDDGAIDSVVVAPGVTIGRDATAAVVDGLGPKVRVLNGTGADRIQVTGAGAADVVKIAGTSGADTVSVVANGTDVAVQGATPGVLVNLTTVETLDVDLSGGADSFSAVGNLAALVSLDVDGGEGDDTILGGNGADVLRGGIGDDFLDGQQGADTIASGDGNDVVQWDPGDGSDTITGGTGSDRMVFNGSSASERFDVSAAAAGHVRFARDIAAINLDLDDVEILDVRSFAGVDTLTVNDLAGTDLTDVRTDLALFGGGDDAAADTVVVNGTAAADTIGVQADGAGVVVAGLQATVRIANAGPTTDRLTVNGLEGVDTLTATPEAGARIIVDLVQ